MSSFAAMYPASNLSEKLYIGLDEQPLQLHWSICTWPQSAKVVFGLKLCT